MEAIRKIAHSLVESYKSITESDTYVSTDQLDKREYVDFTEDQFTRNKDEKERSASRSANRNGEYNSIQSSLTESRLEIEEEIYKKGTKVNQLV